MKNLHWVRQSVIYMGIILLVTLNAIDRFYWQPTHKTHFITFFNDHFEDLIPTPTPIPEPVILSMNPLKRTLIDTMKNYDGTWSIYVKDCSPQGETLILNNQQLPSASLIKLFVAGRYFEAIANGEISHSDASDYWCRAMLEWSDNDAWKNLETYIGYGSYDNGLMSVTDFANRMGCNDTGRLIGSYSIYAADADNYTSVKDVGYVMNEIYNQTYVNEEASTTILTHLDNQYITHKIPAGLPEGINSANKTGELTGIEHDAAIVYGPKRDYILVVMLCDDYDDPTSKIVEISSITYAYMQEESVE